MQIMLIAIVGRDGEMLSLAAGFIIISFISMVHTVLQYKYSTQKR